MAPVSSVAAALAAVVVGAGLSLRQGLDRPLNQQPRQDFRASGARKLRSLAHVGGGGGGVVVWGKRANKRTRFFFIFGASCRTGGGGFQAPAAQQSFASAQSAGFGGGTPAFGATAGGGFGQPQQQAAGFGAQPQQGSGGYKTMGLQPYAITPKKESKVTNGVTTNTNFQHHCITAMPQYEAASLEVSQPPSLS